MVDFLDVLQVVLDHDAHQVLERGLVRVPAQHTLGLGGVAQQLVHLGGAEVLRVHLDEHLARGAVDAFLVDALALPLQFDAGMAEGQGAELPL